MSHLKYCESLTKYQRFKTREVCIGGVSLGGNNPIRIQSMTTTNTMDTENTVKQSIRMIKAGSEFVRITAPSINEAKNLKNIKQSLKSKGYSTPLIADIHFTPNAALIAAEIGFLTLLTPDTAPALSVLPSINEASNSMVPSDVSTPPLPALNKGESSIKLIVFSTASLLEPPLFNTSYPILIALLSALR